MGRLVDRRGILEDEVFAFTKTKDGKVFIFWHGKKVTILNGRKAEKFVADMSNLEGKEAQLLMAKVTGHFKHGNER